MTASVRLFSHSGVVSRNIAGDSGQLSTNASFVLRYPYLAGEVISATSASATSSASATAPAGTKLLDVRVQTGKVVHFEITPNGHTARTATTSSPVLEGNEVFEFGPGWTISLLEATAGDV